MPKTGGPDNVAKSRNAAFEKGVRQSTGADDSDAVEDSREAILEGDTPRAAATTGDLRTGTPVPPDDLRNPTRDDQGRTA